MTEILQWQRWMVECVGGAPEMVIDAPGKGVAIEYYLAVHGIFSTDHEIHCEPTDRLVKGSKEDVMATLGGLSAAKVQELEAHYGPMLVWKKVAYAVANDVMHAAHGSFNYGPFPNMQMAKDIEPERIHAVLCELDPDANRTIIKLYWDGQRWAGAGSLEILETGSDETTIRFGFRGVFEMNGVPGLPFMRAGDQVVDNDGQGRTVYVHRCAQCGTLFARTMRAFVPVFCQDCYDGKNDRSQRTLKL